MQQDQHFFKIVSDILTKKSAVQHFPLNSAFNFLRLFFLFLVFCSPDLFSGRYESRFRSFAGRSFFRQAVEIHQPAPAGFQGIGHNFFIWLSSSVKSNQSARWPPFVLSLRGRYDRSNLPKDRGLLRRLSLTPRNDTQGLAAFGQPLN